MGLGKISQARSPSQGVLGLYKLIIYFGLFWYAALVCSVPEGDNDDDDGDGDDGTERGRLPSGAVARAARGKADGARFAAARGERGYVGYVARGEDADGDGVVELAREVAAAGAA